MAETAPISTTLDFIISVKRMLRSVKSIDFTQAKVTPSFSASNQDDGARSRVLVVKTVQDDSLPIHVLECRQLKNGYVKLSSYQYSKSVKPRSTKRGALRFIMPTGQCKGVRQDLRLALERVQGDNRLRRRLDVESIKVVKDTPRNMEWLILLS
ncbi:hypothetical protein E4U43_001125 [Claviceps pusilla]|uniref:Uncharacterized protein n=1 Tax=Claviceps pusilla TaxID=123648 RepID=A0A9P7SW70_9HYPO|nr:hypothetical protein E4U43_001125 [Claviceps pusilla]